MDEQKYTIQGLDEYIRQGEPQQRERSEAWKVAIGLQQVDRLQTSDYLLDTAKRHIEGDISISEAKELIDSYYQSASGRKDIENDRTPQSATDERSNSRGQMDLHYALQGGRRQESNQPVQSAKTNDELPPKCKICTLEEVVVLRIVQKRPSATQKEIAAEIGKSERTVKSITVSLQEKMILKRENGKRNGFWKIVPND